MIGIGGVGLGLGDVGEAHFGEVTEVPAFGAEQGPVPGAVAEVETGGEDSVAGVGDAVGPSSGQGQVGKDLGGIAAKAEVVQLDAVPVHGQGDGAVQAMDVGDEPGPGGGVGVFAEEGEEGTEIEKVQDDVGGEGAGIVEGQGGAVEVEPQVPAFGRARGFADHDGVGQQDVSVVEGEHSGSRLGPGETGGDFQGAGVGVVADAHREMGRLDAQGSLTGAGDVAAVFGRQLKGAALEGDEVVVGEKGVEDAGVGEGERADIEFNGDVPEAVGQDGIGGLGTEADRAGLRGLGRVVAVMEPELVQVDGEDAARGAVRLGDVDEEIGDALGDDGSHAEGELRGAGAQLGAGEETSGLEADAGVDQPFAFEGEFGGWTEVAGEGGEGGEISVGSEVGFHVPEQGGTADLVEVNGIETGLSANRELGGEGCVVEGPGGLRKIELADVGLEGSAEGMADGRGDPGPGAGDPELVKPEIAHVAEIDAREVQDPRGCSGGATCGRGRAGRGFGGDGFAGGGTFGTAVGVGLGGVRFEVEGDPRDGDRLADDPPVAEGKERDADLRVVGGGRPPIVAAVSADLNAGELNAAGAEAAARGPVDGEPVGMPVQGAFEEACIEGEVGGDQPGDFGDESDSHGQEQPAAGAGTGGRIGPHEVRGTRGCAP